jgi:hypothetical protein
VPRSRRRDSRWFGDGGNGIYTAALIAPVDPEVSAASPAVLLDAIDSFWQRQRATKPGWKDEPRTVIT